MKVLAKIPEDNGNVITYSHGESFVVGEDTCEDCGAPATCIIKGETDSFGFEPVTWCGDCYAKACKHENNEFAALDIEDTQAGAGMAYVIDEGTNIDSGRNFEIATKSYRTAVGFLRQSEDTAAQYAGLYPNHGVQLLKLAELPDWVSELWQDRLRNEV